MAFRPFKSPVMALLVILLSGALTFERAFGDEYGWLPNFREIIDNGRNEILLSGYAWHDPATYDTAARSRLNPYALGGGYARYIVNPDGSTEMLSALAFSDSYRKPQITAEYNKYWSAKLSDNLSFGLGYTVGFSRREDAFHGLPEPIALPLGAIKVGDRFHIYVSYIPPLPKSFGVRGDVAIIFAGIDF